MIVSETIQQINKTFQDNIEKLRNLMNLDDVIQTLCTNALKKIQKTHKQFGIDNQLYDLTSQITLLENIRSNESLKPHYEAMYNQCIVLLVSYFSSAIEELFSVALPVRLKTSGQQTLSHEQLFKVSLADLQELIATPNAVGRFVISKKREDISFQDMKSIARAFNAFLDISIDSSSAGIHNIICAHACRHAIVHSGAVAADRTIGQLKSASKRDLMKDLQVGQNIQFSPDQIELVNKSMKSYVDSLIEKLEDKYNL